MTKVRILFLVLTMLLTGCEIEGGAVRPTDVPPTTEAVTATAPTVVPTSETVARALAERRDTWMISLLDQPADLFPYPASAAARRTLAPINEILFPSPILAYGSGYTTTGVLERIPTLENGDARLLKADVYLDVAGNITTTVTEIITQVNQLEVTFRWNPELHWSDGTPLTADDSVFAYELAKAAPPGDEARILLSQTERYEAVDAHTTRALLHPDLTGWTYFLTYWTPLPRHLLQGVAPDAIRASPFARLPIGYGPYMLESVRDGELHMARNPYYYAAPPALGHVVITFGRDLEAVEAKLANDTLDLAFTDRVTPEQLPTLESITANNVAVAYIANPIWEHIDFNLDLPVLQDIRVRKAIAYGTNRERMVKELYNARTPVLESWILPEQPEAAPPDQLTRYPYDPTQARALLEEAGFVDPDGDGVRASQELTLTLQLFTSDVPIRQRVAELFKEDMRAIGIEIEVVRLSNAELFAADGPLFQRQFELGLYAWIAATDPGGLQMWSCLAVPASQNGWIGENFAGWCFREADQAIREASTTLDPTKRQAAYLRHQQLWTQELPVLPLFQRLSVVLSQPDVRGLRPDMFAPVTWNIASWKRE